MHRLHAVRLTSCSLRAAEHQDEIWLPIIADRINRAPPDSGFGVAVASALAMVLGNNRAGVFLGFFRATGLRMESLMQLGFEDLQREIAAFAQRQKGQEAMAPLRGWEFTMLEHITQECLYQWEQWFYYG